MSTIKVDTIKDTNNVEVYTCKAWVNFDGTQTAASMIRESGNVSSITDNGTGNYTVNFTTSMTDSNYSVLSTPGNFTAQNAGWTSVNGTFNTNNFIIRIRNASNADADLSGISAAVFR